ncbi:MAG: hypothetical protein AAF242_09260, partial [Bacteroidota bacterium]
IDFLTRTRLLPLIILPFMSCNQQTQAVANRNYVDEIIFDPKLDDSDFKTCDDDKYTIQYFNNSKGLEYKGGKPAIEATVIRQYKAPSRKGETGLIRIRFVVNCKGEAGRFRLMGMDESYEEKKFSKKITRQLLDITKRLDGWMVKSLRGNTRDYYQYLIFKIEDSEMVKILP